MKKKKTRRILLTLGALLLVLALVAGTRLFRNTTANSETAQSTTGESAFQENQPALEPIADEAVPLAGIGADAAEEEPKAVAQLPVPGVPEAAQQMNTAPAPAQESAEEPAEPAGEPDEEPAEPAGEPDEIPGEPADEPDENPGEPADEPDEEPADDEPSAASTAAQRLCGRAAALLAEYNACTTNEEKRILLGADNYSLGNDAIRRKLLADLGGSWEQLEEEVVDATEYQQDKTLYVQVYMAGTSDDYQPVVYTTKNADLSGNQWSTNLVYMEDDQTWMEYVKKHPYNDSRVGYYMTSLYNDEDAWDELQDDMQTDGLWDEVDIPEEPTGSEGTPSADPTPADG